MCDELAHILFFAKGFEFVYLKLSWQCFIRPSIIYIGKAPYHVGSCSRNLMYVKES